MDKYINLAFATIAVWSVYIAVQAILAFRAIDLAKVFLLP